ncbi:AMP-dependent synthetase/ligase [Sphingomonas bacterium]|uniref:AMP-dependent synthetase/ligase n=1 Tax=Sphingomonas bacterium TaxID=1895847 RepID=UPI001575D007|nr:AMP-dependent synthetase/ligase [Sphingomonas bacterium]
MRQLEQFPNLVALFLARAAAKGDRPFLRRKIDGAWQATSWAQAAREVASLAAALHALGLQRGDRVMLVSENRPEWCVADLAIMAAGCVTVPTYTTNTERDHQHVLENSGACAVIVSTAKLAKALMPAVLKSNQGQTVIGIDEMRAPVGAVTFHQWHRLLADHDCGPETIVADAGRADLACIIYTSGTGGAPRGVMQHHGAILTNVAGVVEVIAEDYGWGEEVFLSFLPLSHAYEHTAGQFAPIGLGGEIWYAESLEKLAANIAEARPTLMVVVPRLFEVLRARISKAIEKGGGLAVRLLRVALELGAREAAGTSRWRDRPALLAVNTLFRPRMRARFGGRLKALVSGGAPLTPEVGLFFQSIGIELLQGYGQTEAAPVISCNRPKAGIRMDTVGPPLPGVEVRIADDGEILVRGELVMHGYWRNDAETARVLQPDACEPGAGPWLHTGDIGLFDEAGRIRITDRKKDLIITDKGDNVAPQKVEGMLTLQPEIAQAMIVGDRRPHMVALLVPDPDWVQQWCAKESQTCCFARLAENSGFRTALGQAVERVNRDLSVVERIRRFILADEPFTIENGQMTPSLKIRRHVLRDVYGDRLDALYRG